jgi:hypothetical protein
MTELELPPEEYAGPAEVASGEDNSLPVDVQLRGHFEPLDGKFHWYGRVTADADLSGRHHSGETVTLTTAHGKAEGRLSDVDPWGRFRISGTGRPPF